MNKCFDLHQQADTVSSAERLVSKLKERGLTCATAESCTGGCVGGAITAVPGSSAVFLGGVISYANEVKRDVLGVPQEILDTHGAVSSECAERMAAGARALLKSDLAVSLTGIAGPDGGSAEKPVGLVWFGLATPEGVRTENMIFSGDRAAVRSQAVNHALELLMNWTAASGVGTTGHPVARRRSAVWCPQSTRMTSAPMAAPTSASWSVSPIK